MKNKGGRPKKKIDQKEFEKLCGMQCTRPEICAWFETTEKTLDRWCNETYDLSFSLIFQEKRGVGKIALRRNQMQMSAKSPAMAIFLGKNYLGQSDKHEISAETNKTITLNYNLPEKQIGNEQQQKTIDTEAIVKAIDTEAS